MVFDELVHTLDVTASGTRLGSVRRELTVDDEISLFYRQRKMQFRVVWIKKMKGTSEFQIGLRALVQEEKHGDWVLPSRAKRFRRSRRP